VESGGRRNRDEGAREKNRKKRCRRGGVGTAETREALTESEEGTACGLGWGSTGVTADGAKYPK